MIKKLNNKNKIYISYIMFIISLLFLLPLFIGIGCDGTFNYQAPKYNVTGSCKLGIINTYFLPKEKGMNENRYLHLRGLYMKFLDNRAVYIYNVDDSNMIHNRNNIHDLNEFKYKRYYQFYQDHTAKVTGIDTITLSEKNGNTYVVTIKR